MRWLAPLLLTACGPLTVPQGSQSEDGTKLKPIEAVLVMNPLCLIWCDSQLDTAGGTVVGQNAGSFTGNTTSKTQTKTQSGN